MPFNLVMLSTDVIHKFKGIMDVLKEFLESTTIHGLAYISTAKVGVGRVCC